MEWVWILTLKSPSLRYFNVFKIISGELKYEKYHQQELNKMCHFIFNFFHGVFVVFFLLLDVKQRYFYTNIKRFLNVWVIRENIVIAAAKHPVRYEF